MACSNGCIVLDGSNNCSGAAASNSFFDNPANFTIAFWMKTTAIGSGIWNLIDKSEVVSFKGLAVEARQNSGKTVIWANISDGSSSYTIQSSSSAPSLNDGSWHHVAITYDSVAGFHVYIDGTNEDTAPSGSPGVNFSQLLHPVIVADDFTYGAGVQPYSGKFDDFRLYTATLSSGDVSTLASGGEPSTSPVALWKFDETSGTNAADSSGNGNTLAFNNADPGSSGAGVSWSTDKPSALNPCNPPLTWNLSDSMSEGDSIVNQPEPVLTDTIIDTDALVLSGSIRLVESQTIIDGFGQLLYPGFSDSLKMNEWIQFDFEPANPWTNVDNG